MTSVAHPPTVRADPALYTLLMVAPLLSLSRGTAHAMVRNDGRIPAVKLGERWVAPATRFRHWLNGTAPAPDAQGSAVGRARTERSRWAPM